MSTMPKKWTLALVFTFVALGVFAPSSNRVGADEGMWLPPEIGRNLPMKRLKDMGFQLERGDLWNPAEPSLKDAIVQVIDFQPNGGVFGFGSGAFVSDQGLILTNHHVAFDAIAANSDKDNDYVKDGFRAAKLGDELPCRGQGVRICTAYEDVTAACLADVTPNMPEAERRQAVAAARERVIKSAEKKGLKDVDVFALYEGLKYYLVAYDTFRDLRLVYAPPQMIGEYGGDIDNWIWPRHTGDFTYLRAYVAPDGSRAAYSKDNVPFRPAQHLKISTSGYEADDFCFIMGFPGTTYRARTSFSVDYREKILYPNQLRALSERVTALKKAGENDRDAEIRNLSQIKSLNNSLKNFQGMLDGFKKFSLVDAKKAEEKAFQEWVENDATRKGRWGDIFPQFEALYADLFQTDGARNALNFIGGRTFMSGFFALSQPGTPERRQMVVGILKNNFAGLSLEDQRKALRAAIQPIAALPKDARPASIRSANLDNLDAWVESVLPTVFGADDVTRASTLTPESAPGDKSGLIKTAFGLAADSQKLNASMAGFGAKISGLRRRLAEAWGAFKQQPLYPDANSSLRFTYGTIGGYSPADATKMNYYTTPKGILEKNNGRAPFDAPAKQLELIKKEDWGRWADPKLGTLPLNFLSNTDITGGNSGSAIMNGKGEMIGIAFDGNYEAMTSDYVFQSKITRTINVDIRYVMWCTEKLAGMKRLLVEMGLGS